MTFTKMRESQIKSPGLVAYPKILNPVSKVNTIYFATDCRMFLHELICLKAACESEYSNCSKFRNIYESGKISSGVNLAQQESYVVEIYHNSASDFDSTGCFFHITFVRPLNSMHAVL